jgi:tRNA nucleotidyltransferase (CCA-adding enzyme)
VVKLKLPEAARYIINILEANGYEAYAVGGCVRDSLLGKQPKDWDICTSALPEQTMECFKQHHIIETGLQHGTITLMLSHQPYEITTYRIDGVYSDNRRPDTVAFTGSLKDDLSRRDFTINAMAYNPKSGVADYFGGQKDLQSGIIRCVGEADKRFGEDALRIMRALRFASVLGFSIEEDTSCSIFRNMKLLQNIAVERIASELTKLITGGGAFDILVKYTDIIAEFIPEISPMAGFEQNNPHHCNDVLRHTLKSVAYAPSDIVLRLIMLFHDIGKPKCYTEDEGIGHFYGHPQISSDMARGILGRLKFDNNTIDRVTMLILYHDADLQPRRKHIKRWLHKMGEDMFRQLVEVKRADAKAQAAAFRQMKLVVLDEVSVILDEIIAQQQCFSLKDLAVNGRDLLEAGVPQGVQVGVILNRLMDMVIEEQIPNDRAELLAAVQELFLSKVVDNDGI